MSQRLGKATIKANGLILETLPGAKIDIGGTARKPVMGSAGLQGYAEEEKPSVLECEISLGPDTSLDDIREMAGVTVTFECDTGQVYIIREAFVEDTLTLTEGEGGKVPIKFTGPAAEEVF